MYAADIAHAPYHMNNAIAQNIISLNSPAQVESEQQHLKNWRRVTIFCHVMRATVNDTTQNNGPNVHIVCVCVSLCIVGYFHPFPIRSFRPAPDFRFFILLLE